MSEATDHLLHQYFHGYGMQYLTAERQLRKVGTGEDLASRMSNAGIDEADPVVPLMKSVLSALQSEQGHEFDAALSYMDRQAERYRETQLLSPRPDILASDLDYSHGARAVPYLAVRLMKEPDWPDWKVAAVLQYLAMEKDQKALPALARFAAENRNPGYQRMIEGTLEAFDQDAMEQARRNEKLYKSKMQSRRTSE
jgi:hypothetical protein